MPTLSSFPHLLVIPFSDKGHIAPMMVLASKLASEGLRITVIFTDASSAKEWRSDSLNTVLLNKDPHGTKAAALESLIDNLRASECPPTAALVDIMVLWSKPPIERKKVPRYVLYTSSCISLSLMLRMHPRPPRLHRSRAIMESHIGDPEMPPLHSYNWGQDLLDSHGILLNTPYKLETETIDRIQSALAEKGNSLFPVGPLVPMDPDKSKSNTCKEWLDKQQSSSVVYISFGSRTYLDKDQIVEVANGLQKSGQPFLWVLPIPPKYFDADEYLKNVLPEEFRSKPQKGIVVCNWAPQKAILMHSSVGAFVTHCGWNSILESIYLGGNPMLCWPFQADQPANCRFIVDELRVGLEAERDSEGIVSSDEIERKIKALVKDEGMKNRMAEIRTRVSTDESSGDVLSSFARRFYN